MSAQSVIDVARAYLGVTEDPPGSNRTIFGAEYGLDGQPWCVMFLWYCFQHAGERMAFFGGGKTASCGTLLRWYREQGLTVPVEDVQPGDIVILNFSGTKDTEHCGLVTEVLGNGLYVNTIEGNTTNTNKNTCNDSNGGCVASKTRYPSQIVAVCRPQYKAAETGETDCHGPAALAMTGDGGTDDITGHWAERAIRRAISRGLMLGYPDGSFQPDKPVTRAELAVILDRMEDDLR